MSIVYVKKWWTVGDKKLKLFCNSSWGNDTLIRKKELEVNLLNCGDTEIGDQKLRRASNHLSAVHHTRESNSRREGLYFLQNPQRTHKIKDLEKK